MLYRVARLQIRIGEMAIEKVEGEVRFMIVWAAKAQVVDLMTYSETTFLIQSMHASTASRHTTLPNSCFNILGGDIQIE